MHPPFVQIHGDPNSPQVRILDADFGPTGIAHEPSINKIFTGYRQCYSKHPFSFSVPQHKRPELLMEYKERIQKRMKFFSAAMSEWITEEVPKEQYLQKLIEKVGYEPFTDFLYKCKFIQKHMHHESQLEHATLTVRISNFSRCAAQQITRHRLSSFGMASQRYISESIPEYVIPATIRDNPDALARMKGWLDQLPSVIADLKEMDIPDEDIRYCYPGGIQTELVMTANWRSWLTIMNLRRCQRSQWEIRAVADIVYNYFLDRVPFVFDKVTPFCRTLGKCPEEKSCGHPPAGF